MSDPPTEVGTNGQSSEAPNEGAVAAGSGADVPAKQESVGTEQGSQSALPAAAEAGSTGIVTAASEPSAGAESAAPSGDEVTTETAESPATGEVVPAAADGAAGQTQAAEEAAADGAGDQAAAPGQQQQQEAAPRLAKVVHSARSVFRQRDVKEYDPFTAHLERRITKLFEALDTEETGRVDVHELGTLVRSVGCCPSESELQEMVTQLEEEGQPGFIRLQTVTPYIIQCVEDRKYPSASAEQLLQAFQVLADDCAAQEEARAGPKREKKEEEKDTLPQDKLVHILTEEGEHFSQEEVEETLSVVPASETGRVRYTEFVKQLVVPELW